MSEIVDVVAKLSYQVEGTEDIANASKEFQKNANNIDAMNKKLEQLKIAMKGATDVNEQQRLSNAILRTQKAIDQQTASAAKALSQSKAFQQVVQQETGLIQKLNDKLSDLKRARESQTTVDGIKEINKALRETTAELQKLTTIEQAEGGRSLLSTLFGADSGAGAGKQILQGALSGIGIGAGFSILPAITSALVDYAKVMSDVEQRTEDVFAATKALTEGLGGLLEVLTQIEQTRIGSIYDQALPQDPEAAAALLSVTKEGIKRDIDALNAAGAINGEVFKFTQQQAESSKKQLREQNIELEKQKKNLDDILDILNQTDTGKKGGITLFNRISSIFSATTSADIKERAAGAIEQIRGSLLPQQAKEQIAAALYKAGEEGANLDDAFAKAIQSYQSARAKIVDDIRTNLADQRNVDVELINKNAEAVRTLTRSLEEEARKEALQTQQYKASIREQDASVIRATIKRDTDFQIAEIDRFLKEERKKYATDANGRIVPVSIGGKLFDPEAQAEKKKAEIRKQGQLKTTEELRAYYQQQLQLQEQFNQAQISEDIRATKQRISETTDPTTNLELRRQLNEQELQLQLAKISQEATVQTQALQKQQEERRQFGETNTVDYQQTEDRINAILEDSVQQQNDAIRKANTEKYNIYSQFFNQDLLPLIRQQADLLKSQAQLEASAITREAEQNGGSLVETIFFGADFEKNIAGKRAQIVNLKASILNARNELAEQTKRRNAAQGSLAVATATGDTGTIKSATAEVAAAQTSINQLNATINQGEEGITKIGKSIKTDYVKAISDSFLQMVDIAAGAFRTINEARQQDLQREIEVGNARVELAFKLAERGNTIALQQEQERLRASVVEKRKAALELQAINAGIALSSSIVAVAQAAALPPPFNLAAIPAVIAALATGYSTISSLTRSQQLQGFKDGVVDFDGEGTGTSDSNIVRISRGESVMTEKATKRYKGMLEAMNDGTFMVQKLPEYLSHDSISRKEFDNMTIALSQKLDNVVDAVSSIKIHQSVDEMGVNQMVQRSTRAERLKWVGA